MQFSQELLSRFAPLQSIYRLLQTRIHLQAWNFSRTVVQIFIKFDLGKFLLKSVQFVLKHTPIMSTLQDLRMFLHADMTGWGISRQLWLPWSLWDPSRELLQHTHILFSYWNRRHGSAVMKILFFLSRENFIVEAVFPYNLIMSGTETLMLRLSHISTNNNKKSNDYYLWEFPTQKQLLTAC